MIGGRMVEVSLMDGISGAIADNAFLLFLDDLVYALVLFLTSVTVLTVLVLSSTVLIVTIIVLIHKLLFFIDPEK